jgi:peptidoglycan/LPS O-acetylase OafA/YrhL
MSEDARHNNFGFLRLLFASLVIVSHSFELIDGNRSRELLTRIFGTMTFGEIAVDGFFLISGYLITKSFVERRSVWSYLAKRVARIVPGFAVSFALCAFVLAPLVGGALSPQVIAHQFWLLLRLAPPDVPGAFDGLPYPQLNGSMWTIRYEFICYLVAAVIGLLGAYNQRWHWVLLVATGAALLASASGIGSHHDAVRFFAVFEVGALYYLFRDGIILDGRAAVPAVIAVLSALLVPWLADTWVAIFGGYLIFWFALKVPAFSRIGDNTDISYGVYLYAWPIQNIIIWNDRTIDPWVLCGVTLAGSCLAGWLSWVLVEKPCMELLKRKRVAPGPVIPIEGRTIRGGDHVFHRPTGETWTIEYVKGDYLAWCGFPRGEARVADCDLVMACSDEEHAKFEAMRNRK